MIKIAASPGFANKNSNPYNYLLYNGIRNLDAIVYDGFLNALCQKVDIWHTHWPEAPLNNGSLIKKYVGLIKLLFKFFLCKVLKIKIVWTAHNLDPHESQDVFLKKLLYVFLGKYCDGIIFLSNHARSSFIKSYELRGESIVIPHGDYVRYISEMSNNDALEDKSDYEILYFGQIRNYKNIPHLIDVFDECAYSDYRLTIAGKIYGQDLKAEIERKLDASSGGIQLINKFLTDLELIELCRKSSFVILPYKQVTNSGSLLYALSLNIPVMAPWNPAFAEIQASVGDEWLHLYKSPLNANKFKAGLQRMSEAARGSTPDLSAYAWEKIAHQTECFFSSLLKGSKRDNLTL